MRRLCKLTLAGAALLAAALGCGLTNFTVDTDWQSFTVDSASIGLTLPAGSAIPAVPCTAGASDICKAATSPIKCSGTSYSCSVACGPKSTCAITATAEQSVPIDLSSQIKNNTTASALNKVSLQRAVLNTEENTLTFNTPSVELYVGPEGAKKTTDPGVVLFGTIPSIKSKEILNQQIPATEQGKAKLAEFVKNYQTPFRMLAKAALGFASGDPVPQGRLTLKVKAYFEIEPLK